MNMDEEKSKIGFERLTMEDSKLSSVYALRNSPFRVATACLGLLCVILLAVVIGQSVHHRKVEQNYQNDLQAMRKEKETLKENLKELQMKKRDLVDERNKLLELNGYLLTTKAQLQANNNLLTEKRDTLKRSHSQLQANYTALSKQTEQLVASRDKLQTINTDLSAAQGLLQKQRDSAINRKNELQADLDTVTKDRNNLQNKFNNVTRSRDQMQASYNTMIKDVERLQDRYNFSSTEKDKIAGSHQNLTRELVILQDTYNLLRSATDGLQASYTSLVQEKNGLERSCKNVTVDRDLLNTKNHNLTAERDQLQVELERLNGTIQVKRCPSSWTKFQINCYYSSAGKKTWLQSRAFCQGKGGDLATIKNPETLTFINSLYSSDKEVWIGLSDEGVEGQWTWVDGTPLTTAYWGKDQPNSYDGRNQDCVEYWHRATGNGEWNDENCNIEQNWICEM